MTIKKRNRKIIIICSIIILPVLVGFLSLRYGGYLIIDKEDRKYIMNEVKNSPQLPERFYEIYNIMYPNVLENTTFGVYFYNELYTILGLRKKIGECPCEEAAYHSLYLKYVGTEMRLVSFIYDDYLTQKECLNFYVTKVDFLSGNIGIERFSDQYFNKSVSLLNDKEIIEVILTMKAPTVYNRKRYPERVDIAVNQILGEIYNNEKISF